MNILKILIESVKIYKSNKLIWLLGLGIALLTIDVFSTLPAENAGLRCLIAPIQLTLFIISSLIATSLVILTFNCVQSKSAPYSEVWKEAKSKFFFRLIGAAFLYVLIILVFLFIYLVLYRFYGSSLLFGLFTILFWAVFASQGSFISKAIIIDDFEVGKALRRGLSLPIRFFFFVVPIAILFTLVNIGITFIFVSVYNSLGITNQIAIPEAHFYNSYLRFIGFTPVRIFNIFIQIFLAPLQSIAFTLAYLKLTPRVVKPETDSSLELENGADPV
jgi:hypothetical protein